MFDEVHTFSKIKDNSINDIIKTTKFFIFVWPWAYINKLGDRLGESLWMAVIRKDLNFQDGYHK